MQLLLHIYGYLRMLSIIIHNLYHIPAYLFLNWVILIPLKLIKSSLYDRIENYLYSSCLYTVSSWSWCAGIHVFELGADISQIVSQSSKRTKILVVGNHQSTGDVPLFMYAMTAHSEYILMWVMLAEFRFTNFGPVSYTHQDYFLSQRTHVKGDLIKHCLGSRDQRKNCYILFPEGGFRYKKLANSDSFAQKNNLPLLRRVVWPRYGAFEELVDERLGVTHIVDLTIMYKDQDDTLSIFDIAKGLRKEPVYLLYKVYEISNDNDDFKSNSSEKETLNYYQRLNRKNINLEWFQSLWKEKEQILEDFYTDRNKIFQAYGNGRLVELSYLKVISIHIVYLVVTLSLASALYLSYSAVSKQLLNHY